MTNRIAFKPMDPRTLRSLAKTAGDRAPKTVPMSLEDRTRGYYRQNGRRQLTVGQERRIRKQHGMKALDFVLAGGVR